ncbi:MAG: preprotein translocase subunit YajC, partial [Duncaniella sp.]|nr:preprotein translocase subunit YajC [Duncaniella sp.]
MLNTILLQAGANSGVMNIIMIVAVIAIFYFFMIRPQQKRQNEIKKFREGVKVGDQIVTAGGIYGKVKSVKENTFGVQIANDVV